MEGKKYLCGGVEDLKKLEVPSIEGEDVVKKNFCDYIKEIKRFLVEMKTKASEEESIEEVIKNLDKKTFKPRFKSHYEFFLMKVFNLLNKKSSDIEKFDGLKKLCIEYDKKYKNIDRHSKVEGLFNKTITVTEIIREEDREMKFMYFNEKKVEGSCVLKDKILTAIFGPNVEKIEEKVFQKAIHLTKISFGPTIPGKNECKPNNLSKCKIGKDAFKECKNISKISYFPLGANSKEEVEAAFDEKVATAINKAREKYEPGQYNPIIEIK